MQRNITASGEDYDMIEDLFQIIWKDLFDFNKEPMFPSCYTITRWVENHSQAYPHEYWKASEEEGQPTLMFFKGEVKDAIKLAYPHPAEDAARMTVGWLKNLKSEDYPIPYNGDGSNEKGFWLTTNDLYLFQPNYPIVVIRPAWIFYGK